MFQQDMIFLFVFLNPVITKIQHLDVLVYQFKYGETYSGNTIFP
jgi:hypothetical protein